MSCGSCDEGLSQRALGICAAHFTLAGAGCRATAADLKLAPHDNNVGMKSAASLSISHNIHATTPKDCWSINCIQLLDTANTGPSANPTKPQFQREQIKNRKLLIPNLARYLSGSRCCVFRLLLFWVVCVVVVCYFENNNVSLLRSKRRAFKKLPSDAPPAQWGNFA